MLNVQCRLCSSTKALISLFGGKSRANRDYIRKLVDITTGIQFQKNDAYKCICFSCIIQIYNFYIFKFRSKENEGKLQVYIESSEKVKPSKIEVQRLDDITLPSVEELKETLTPWLVSKQEYCESIDTEGEENVDSFSKQHSNNPHNIELVENSTQCDSIVHFSKNTQYELSSNEVSTQTKKLAAKTAKIQCELVKKKESKELASQTDEDNTSCSAVESINKETQCELSSVEVYTQTKKLPMKSIKIQCELVKKKESKEFASQTDDNISHSTVESINKETQCELSSVEAYTQTRKLPTKSIKIQCELVKTNQKNPKNKSKLTQIDEDSAAYDSLGNSNNETQCNLDQEIPKAGNNESTQTKEHSMCYSVECYDKETQHKLTAVEVQIQTNELATRTIKTRRELLKLHQKLKKTRRECTTQTESENVICSNRSTQCNYDDGEVDLKTSLRLMDIKQETHRLSLPVRSPITCLSINVDGSKNEALASPGIGYASPKSSDLLTIKNKIQNVIICAECDQVVYSKNEYKLHNKSHMLCSFCKKRFTSIKRTKLHIQNDCAIQKLIKIEPVVSLVRLESLIEVREKYPKCFEILKEFHKWNYNKVNSDIKKKCRIRSRSVSSIDSFINCTTCRSCISVLKRISVGVDKSVQVNLFLDKDLISPLECFYKNAYIKRNLKDSVEDNSIPVKKVKMSPLVSS